jgi:HEAT repeats
MYEAKMGSHSVEIIKAAALILGLTTLGAAVTIFLLMETVFRRRQSLQVRRLMLASRLSPSPEEKDPDVSWSHSSRSDREIILDILVDQSISAGAKWRNAIRQTLFGLGVYDGWISELRDGSVARKVRAANRLGAIQDPRGIQALVNAATDPSRRVGLAVVLALGRLKDPEGISGLMRIAGRSDRAVPDLTLAAALAACAEGKPALLNDLLRSPVPRLRIMATWALSEVADPSVLEPVLDVTSDPDPEVRGKSARALARIRNHKAVAALMRLARDPVWFVRVRALDALGELGHPEGEPVAMQGLEDPMKEVRYRAASALRQILGMKGEVAAKVLSTASRRGFNSLISEWDRAGFLGQVVEGLSTRDWARFQESMKTVRILIEAGVTHALGNFIVVYPDVKVRLRLARLFAESASTKRRAELVATGRHPMCHPLVRKKIEKIIHAGPWRQGQAARQEGTAT